MILRHAFRELAAHPARTILGVAGVAVSAAMLVDMLMLSNGLQTSFRDLLGGAGYEIRVSPPGTLPLDTEATISGASGVLGRLAREPDVAEVAPVLAANLSRSDDRGERTVFALGVDPASQGVFRLREGRAPRAGEVVVGADPGGGDGDASGRLVPPDSVRLAAFRTLGTVAGGAPRTVRVVGSAEFLYVSESEEPVALALATLQEITGRVDEVSFAMIAAAPGVSPDSLARRLASAYPEIRVVSIGELVAQAEQRLSYFRQLAIILGTVSLVVAALLIGTLASMSINERYGTIAAARAIGISRRSILLSLLAESLVQSGAAVLIGLGLGLLASGRLERILSDFPGLPEAVRFFVPEPRVLAAASLAILGIAAVASLLPAYRVTRLPIATTLHREEP